MKKSLLLAFLIMSIFLTSCAQNQNQKMAQATLSDAEKASLSQATFAGGCFWCVEAVFERVKGVRSAVSGYAGGSEQNPTYENVSAGKTSHAEAVTIYFDSTEVEFSTLLEVFFATHDPTTLNRQGPDVGAQYRSVVFYHNDAQQRETEEYLSELEVTGKFKDPVVTQVVPFEKFYEAEDYHQDYYAHHPNDAYIQAVTQPKIEKFEKEFKTLLKEAYK